MSNTPERLKKVQDLFHAALAVNASARSSFLENACSSDHELLDEVRSLISAHEQDGSFIDSPVGQPISEMLASLSSESYIGQTVGSFRILSQLGRGGMGVVYLAEDLKLGRKVALKVLPEELSRRDDLVRRFALESKAASGLNHPNIVTVYEIGKTGSSEYIATEYIEGENLRHHFASGRMSLRDALDVLIQVASALAAAHGAGIIHRDIKPENIMLRPDGYVKVLDFGLAKAIAGTRPGSPFADLEAATLVKMETEPGAMIGTVYYMAPEQARGQDVDARADIFSVGVLAYEMIAGRRPFGGETNLDALISTLEREPQPLASCAPGAPPEIQRIVSRALRKDREERYQTINEMLIDLKNLREDIAFEAKRDRASQHESNVTSSTPTSVQQSVLTSNAQAIRTSALRKRSLAAPVIGALILVAIGIIAVKMWPSSAPIRSEAPPAVAAERVLNYWVTVQKFRDGKYRQPIRLPGEILFEKDDQVRLHVGSAQDGHLYVFNEGPPGGDRLPPLNVLFPSPTANTGSSRVSSGQTIDIPRESWLRFDQQEGTEKLWLVWSVNSLPDLESTKKFANEKDRGVIGSPGLDRLVRDFLAKTYAASKPTVAKDDSTKETHVKANADIVVHVLALEHH